jgi:hypothetical protein
VQRSGKLGNFVALLLVVASAKAQEVPLQRGGRDEIDLRVDRAYQHFVYAPISQHQRLMAIVQAVISARIDSNFLGYEQSSDFRLGASSAYDRLGSSLVAVDNLVAWGRSAELRDSLFNAVEVKHLAAASLDSNGADFDRFYFTVAGRDPILSMLSPEEIKDAMLAFSTLVYLQDPVAWQNSSRSSYFWPFCRKRGE